MSQCTSKSSPNFRKEFLFVLLENCSNWTWNFSACNQWAALLNHSPFLFYSPFYRSHLHCIANFFWNFFSFRGSKSCAWKPLVQVTDLPASFGHGSCTIFLDSNLILKTYVCHTCLQPVAYIFKQVRTSRSLQLWNIWDFIIKGL